MSPRSLALSFALLVVAVPARGQPAEAKPVTVHVLLPAADATLLFDDRPTRQTGIDRLFTSPPIEPGKTFHYTLKATWAPNNYTTITRTRVVPVKAGERVEADLRQADEKKPDKIVIRYVPTPQEVVDAMLKLGQVGKDDVVYDLGCGDGRIVVTAVKKFNAKRGVGIDLDPQRISESKANARAAGVEDRVEFRQGDVFEVKDLADATVVTLYMSDELNLQLRPILQRTLKPGTRVVSHRFTMGDWKPLQTDTVTDPFGQKYNLLLWKIGDGKK